MNYYHYPEPVYSSYYQLDSEDYEIRIRQQPKDALLAVDGKEKNRKPVDPPPIIEVNVRQEADPIRQYLQSPYLFMCASLVPADADVRTYESEENLEKGLCGTAVSSLHRLKDIDNKDGGFFVFGDVSVKRLGEHRLRFSLFELRRETGNVVFLKSTLSQIFTVYQSKEWPGLDESTHLSRTFADQGVRLRLRKEARTISGASSGSKRTYSTYSQSPAQSGSSIQQAALQTPGSYQIAQQLSSSYPSYGEQAIKRQRAEEMSQQYGYSPGMGVPGASTSYGRAGQMPQVPLQSQSYAQTPSSGSRWPQNYGQASSSPTAQSDFGFGTPYQSRQESMGSMQYGNPNVPLYTQPGYQRAAPTMYTPQRGGSPQQQIGPSPGYAQSIGSTGPMTPHLQDSHGSSTLMTPTSSSSIHSAPAAAPYQAQSLPFTVSSEPSQYTPSHAPPYRDEHSYSSLPSTIGATEQLQSQPLPSLMSTFPSRPLQQDQSNMYPEGSMQSQMGNLPQGYPGSYHGSGRSNYQS